MTITNTLPDLVYYEIINPFDIFAIEMDWVVVDIAPTNTGPWITVFDWGDNNPDNNTNIAGFSVGGELDNERIELIYLYASPAQPILQTGITIDVDALAPPGVYQWVRIYGRPLGSNDPAEVDALEVLP